MSTRMSVDMVQMRPSVKTSGNPPGGRSTISFGDDRPERPTPNRSAVTNGHLAPAGQWSDAPAAGSTSTEASWSEYVAGNGQKYYYNKVTRESTWERPAELGPNGASQPSPKAEAVRSPLLTPKSPVSFSSPVSSELDLKFRALQSREADAQARIADLENRQRLTELEYKQRIADLEIQHRAKLSDLEAENRNLKAGHTTFQMELDDLKRRHREFESMLQALLKSQNVNDVSALRVQLADLQLKIKASEGAVRSTDHGAPSPSRRDSDFPSGGSRLSPLPSPGDSARSFGSSLAPSPNLGRTQSNGKAQVQPSGSFGYNPPGGRTSIVISDDSNVASPAASQRRDQRSPQPPQGQRQHQPEAEAFVRVRHPPGGASSFSFG